MQLVFKSPHISIEQFNPVEIPDFTVLTGVNGSGKSHLLQAIENGSVDIAGIQNPNIVLFNYETFRLENEGAFNGQQLSSERESAWNYFESDVKNNAQSWRSKLGEEYNGLKSKCEKEKKKLWYQRGDKIQEYRNHFKGFFSHRKRKQNEQAQGVYALAKKLPYSIDEISREDFINLYKPYAFKNDFLPQQLGKVFWDYYVKYRGNQINQFENEKYGKDYPALTEEQFIESHGPKPWDIINEILETFDTLQYKVNSPEGEDYFGSFQLKLKHTERKNVEIEFSSLSSGEKILMALVASVYKSSTDKSFPDVLLLDEVDASLHPSMMKNMLEVIENIFLKQGVKVILVTHSPTTIALAPEDSIFVMNRSGKNRIEKKSKQEALSILTEGFATIEQGLKLFDEVAKSEITIITEGKNTLLVSKALELYGVTGVEVLTGVEGASGKSQLKTLYDFLYRADHVNKVIFVWDCDASYDLEADNNTYPFILPQNEKNKISMKGIENIFSESLFDDFKKTITTSTGEVIVQFDEHRKADFTSFVIGRGKKEDFQNFESMVEEVKRIKQLGKELKAA